MTVRSALARINEILDQVLNEQEGDFDAATRFAIAWYRQHGYATGKFGVADDLARARNTAVETLVRDGILTSAAGKVTLLSPAEMPEGYDVLADDRVGAWEVLHHLIALPRARRPAGRRRVPRERAGAPRRRDRRRARQGARVPAVRDRREERLDPGRARVQHRRHRLAGHRARGALDASRHGRAGRVRLRGGLTDGDLQPRPHRQDVRAARAGARRLHRARCRPGAARGRRVDGARGDEGQEEGRSRARSTTALDPQVQLRMLTENIPHHVKPGWYPFDGAIGRVGQGYSQGAARGPQRRGRTTSRSATTTPTGASTPPSGCSALIGAPDVADEVKAIRLGLRRVTADKDDRKVLKSAAVTPESAGLRPWREVLAPHDDVATGNFQAAEFAADLYKVARPAGCGQGLRRPGRVLRAHVPHRGPARPHRPRGAAPGGRPERLAGDQPADQLRRRQDALDARAVAPRVGHAARRLPAGRPGPALARRGFGELPGGVRRVALVGNHISPVGLGQGRRHAGQHDLGRARLAARRHGGVRDGRDSRRRPHPARARRCTTLLAALRARR